MKKCPLLIGKVSIPECQKEQCAWWDEQKKCCAVVVKQPKAGRPKKDETV